MSSALTKSLFSASRHKMQLQENLISVLRNRRNELRWRFYAVTHSSTHTQRVPAEGSRPEAPPLSVLDLRRLCFIGRVWVCVCVSSRVCNCTLRLIWECNRQIFSELCAAHQVIRFCAAFSCGRDGLSVSSSVGSPGGGNAVGPNH